MFDTSNPYLDQLAQERAGNSQVAPVGFNQPQPAQAAPEATPAVAPGSPASLVNWNGYRISSNLVPHVTALTQVFPGLRQTSGYRSEAENRAAHGVPHSEHLSGNAADFVGSSADMQRAAAWARSNGAKEALVHNAGSGFHLHVSW